MSAVNSIRTDFVQIFFWQIQEFFNHLERNKMDSMLKWTEPIIWAYSVISIECVVFHFNNMIAVDVISLTWSVYSHRMMCHVLCCAYIKRMEIKAFEMLSSHYTYTFASSLRARRLIHANTWKSMRSSLNCPSFSFFSHTRLQILWCVCWNRVNVQTHNFTCWMTDARTIRFNSIRSEFF